LSSLNIPTAKVFRPLLGNYRYKGAHGGRGSGKSHFFAGLGIENCLIRPPFSLLCIREIQKSLKDSAKRLLENKIRDHEAGGAFDARNDEIRTPGGGVISFVGMQDHTAESVKSFEDYDAAWIEEGQTLSARSLELLRPTIRKPGSEIWGGWNPRHETDPIDRLLRGTALPQSAMVVRANYTDNPWFPAELEDERQFDLKNNPDRYAHIWLGEYEPTAIGAIWDRQTIHAHRREAATCERIVIAVDPAVSSEAGSNEHGIIVCGLGEDQRGYVLDDYSLGGTPREWANRAIAAYDRYEADAIVIEVNQGGDMVRHTLEAARPGLPIVEVRATRGKHVRAEPISALYQLGRISHVGAFPELESQMCQMTAAGYEGQGSPDRVDALVWAFTELFPQMTREKSNPKHVEAPAMSGGWMA
tara:strand:+ start:1935 stop:3182 length:1248 start_codon:yes stop_codon:yes gene_type:complete